MVLCDGVKAAFTFGSKPCSDLTLLLAGRQGKGLCLGDALCYETVPW